VYVLYNRLSAFVMKCFHEAKNYIPIDDSQISVTLNWVINGQSNNGSFYEPPNGRVIHTDMQVQLLSDPLDKLTDYKFSI